MQSHKYPTNQHGGLETLRVLVIKSAVLHEVHMYSEGGMKEVHMRDEWIEDCVRGITEETTFAVVGNERRQRIVIIPSNVLIDVWTGQPRLMILAQWLQTFLDFLLRVRCSRSCSLSDFLVQKPDVVCHIVQLNRCEG